MSQEACQGEQMLSLLAVPGWERGAQARDQVRWSARKGLS